MNFVQLNISFNQIILSFKTIGKENLQKRLKYIYKFQNDQFEDYKSFHNFKKVVEVVENWEKNIENIKIMEN